MSDPKEQQEERDELDLDTETIKDLEPNEQAAEQVFGGRSSSGGSIVGPASGGV